MSTCWGTLEIGTDVNWAMSVCHAAYRHQLGDVCDGRFEDYGRQLGDVRTSCSPPVYVNWATYISLLFERQLGDVIGFNRNRLRMEAPVAVLFE